MGIFHALLDLLFPMECVACGTNDTPFCRACLEKVPAAPDIEHPSISALYSYQYPAIKKALWALKYGNNTAPAKIFGASLYEYLLAHAYEFTAFSSAK